MSMITLPTTDYSVLDRIRQSGLDRDEALAVGRNRQQFLQDVAGAREFSETAAGKASARRMKEAAETDRLKLVEQLNAMGVPVKSDMSMEDAGAALRDFNQKKAVAGAEIIQTQMDAAEVKQRAAMKGVLDVATMKGNAQLYKDALNAALVDPSSKFIPSADRAKMVSTLTNATTPQQVEDAVNQVVKHMQNDYFTPASFLPGVYGKTRAFDQAQAFFQKFDSEVKAKVDPVKQTAFTTAMANYQDANRQAETLASKMGDHLSQYAAVLPSDTRKGILDRIGPPKNPADILPGNASRVPQDAPPAPMITDSPPVPATGASAPPLPPRTTGAASVPDNKGLISDLFNNITQKAPGPLPQLDTTGRPINLALGQTPSAFDPQAFGIKGTSHPFQSPADLADLQKKVGDPSITTDEVLKLKQAALARGMSMDQANAHEAALKAGDPAEIAKFKQGIQMLRNGAFEDLPAGAGGGDQATAPPVPVTQ